MNVRSRGLLRDMLDAAEALHDRYGSISDEMYLANMFDRWAVERGLEIIGEAARQLIDSDPEVGAAIPEMKGIIGTRNAIAHGYATVDHDIVLFIVREKLPELIQLLRSMLDQ